VSGDVFVSDPGSVSGQRVERFDGGGGFVGLWSVDPLVFGSLGAVGVDSGVGGGVYVMALDAVSGAAVVPKYTAGGVFEHVLDVSGSTLSINYGPVVVDPSDGSVLVVATDFADPGFPEQVVARFDQSGVLLGSFRGLSSWCPSGLGVDGSHRVYVVDGCRGRVDRYTTSGTFVATVDNGSRGAPSAVAVDPVSGEVFVVEQGVLGLQATHFTTGGTAPLQSFSLASVGGLAGFAAGPDGTVYAGDYTASEVERFTAFVGPTVTTGSVANPGPLSATLDGTIDPGGVQASYRYEYGLDTNYGQSTTAIDAGSGSGVAPAPALVTGLAPNTTYHYRIVGSNSGGEILGEDQSFVTDPIAPVVDGSPAFASAITPTSAQIHGTVNPNRSPTNVQVEYGTTTAYGSAVSGDPVDGSIDTVVAINVTDLVPGTLYHFRMTAENGAGSPQQGADQTFITAPAAAAGASGVTTQTATLVGTVDPHGVQTTYRFDYGQGAGFGLSTPEFSAGSSDGEISVSAPVTSLVSGRTYHVQLVATSTNGQVRTGAAGAFDTLAGPVAVGVGAIDVTTSSATLVGTADTHGLPGSYRFEVSSLDGSYTTTSSERPTPAANGPQRVTATLTGLPQGQGFSARLVVSGEGGATSYSSMFPFATPAPPQAPPPSPTAVVYGCVAPSLKAYNAKPKAGESISITGSDLGVGGSVTLGNQTVTSADWSAAGLTVDVPDDAAGTLGLTVNCGRVSNTIAVTIAPDNTLAVTKHTTTATTASITVGVKAPGVIRATGSRIKTSSVQVAQAGAKTIKVQLSAAGKRALAKARSRKLKTTITLRYTPVGGQPTTKTVALTFTRKSKTSR
jgi:hypothetical protein